MEATARGGLGQFLGRSGEEARRSAAPAASAAPRTRLPACALTLSLQLSSSVRQAPSHHLLADSEPLSGLRERYAIPRDPDRGIARDQERARHPVRRSLHRRAPEAAAIVGDGPVRFMFEHEVRQLVSERTRLPDRRV
jgi:hypothetical protein